jgi:hypothetical protein
MKERIEKILSMSSISEEQKKLYSDLAADPVAMSQAEEICKLLYAEDRDHNIARSLLYADEDEEKCLIFALAYLQRMVLAEEVFAERGIPAEHLQTLVDIWENVLVRSRAKFGKEGINALYRGFIFSYMIPARFNIGRINFEIGYNDDGYEVYETEKGLETVLVGEKPPKGKRLLAAGDPILRVHIPAKGRLVPELADAAFEEAKEFFAKYYPEHKWKTFLCSSWLLDPNLQKILKPDSNIINFQNRFTIGNATENNMSLCWHVFGIDAFLDPAELTPKNDFQERMLNYVKAGNKLQNGKGFIADTFKR